MAIGIYKPGHGYWVRVLSAVGAGLLVLATAAWLWGETAALNLPNSAWNITLSGDTTGALTPGQTVTVSGASSETGELVEIGTMVVESFEASEFAPKVRLIEPQLIEGLVPSDIEVIEAEGFHASIGDGGSIQPIPVIDPLYVQGSVAGLALLIGAVLVFYLTGSRPSSCEFLIATDGEMKKVNWSTRREVLGSTWVVIVASFLIAAILYVVDMGFQWFFVSIEVLQR